MHLFIFALFLSLFVFLFCLYFLVHDDFILLKKDISTEKIFNLAIVLILPTILLARILFVVIHPNSSFFNPFIFLLFPYFPGLSLIGGGVGGFLVLLLILKYNKLPVRLLDFFSIAFLSSLPIGFLGYFLEFHTKLIAVKPLFTLIIYTALFFLFIKFFLPKLLNGKFKDGTIGILFLILFSLTFFIESLIGDQGLKFNLKIDNLLSLFTLIISLLFLARQEDLLEKIKKLRGGLS